MIRASIAALAVAFFTAPLAAQGVPADSSGAVHLQAIDTVTTRSVTLAEAIRLADQTQPTVVQAQAGLSESQARLLSAKGAFLPSLSVSSSGSRSSSGNTRTDEAGNVVGAGSNTTVSTRISASVDLFTGFRRGANMRAAHANENASSASLVNAHFQQALTTTNQFFSALAARELLSVRVASVRRAEQQLAVSVAKLHAGSATRSDSLKSLVTLGTAQLALVQAESDLATAEAGLARLIGATGRVAAADDSSFYQVLAPLDTAELRTEALAQSPQVRSAEASATAAQASVKAAQAAYWPSLTLSASTGWNGRNPDYDFTNNKQISLGLSWNIFNGFNREQQISISKSQSDVAQAQADDAKRQVAANLTSQLAQLDAARIRIGITRTSVTAAKEDLRVVQERYRLGVATIVDVLTSQEALDQAEVDEVNARFDYLRAKAQLEALIGRKL